MHILLCNTDTAGDRFTSVRASGHINLDWVVSDRCYCSIMARKYWSVSGHANIRLINYFDTVAGENKFM